MTTETFSPDDIERNRQRSVLALQNIGYVLVPDTEWYQPLLQKGEKFVLLRRILKTPLFEVVNVDPSSAVPRDLDHPTKPCDSCRMPIIWATSAAGKAMPFDQGLVAGGQWVLRDGELPDGRTGLVAVYDKDAPYAHRSHFATCPHAHHHRKAKVA